MSEDNGFGHGGGEDHRSAPVRRSFRSSGEDLRRSGGGEDLAGVSRTPSSARSSSNSDLDALRREVEGLEAEVDSAEKKELLKRKEAAKRRLRDLRGPK